MQELIDSLDKILTLSNSAMVFGGCLVLGYVFRFIKKFPNDAIPIIVILNGAILMTLLADKREPVVTAHVWATRHMVAGAIIGFVAWMAHNTVISRIEDWLSQRFAVVDKLFNGKTDKDKPL